MSVTSAILIKVAKTRGKYNRVTIFLVAYYTIIHKMMVLLLGKSRGILNFTKS